MDQSQRHGVSHRESESLERQDLTILLFASAAQLAGARKVNIKVAIPMTVKSLASVLSEEYPSLEPIIRRSRFAVNAQFVDNESVLIDPKSEIALIPPVSGG